MILAKGAKQLVVQEALEKTKSSSVIIESLTPNTIVLASGDGAEMITFFAPAMTCFKASSFLRNRPVDSKTTSTFKSFQGNSWGFGLEKIGISLESTIM